MDNTPTPQTLRRAKSQRVDFIGIVMFIFSFLIVAGAVQFVQRSGLHLGKLLPNASQLSNILRWEMDGVIDLLLIAIVFFYNIFLLFAGISLMQRKHWARVFCKYHFCLMLVRNVGAAIWLVSFCVDMLKEGGKGTGLVMPIEMVLLAIIAINALIYLFFLKVITSDKIKQEFQAA